MSKRRLFTTLKCVAAAVVAKICDISFIREVIEVESTPSSETSWRKFKPGDETIELTVFGGRNVQNALREYKDVEQECVIVFPDGTTFMFDGELSKVKARRRKLFEQKKLDIVIGQIRNKQYKEIFKN